MNMETIEVPVVVSLGGSVVVPGKRKRKKITNPIFSDIDKINDICEILAEFKERLAIVVGGGAPCRSYVDLANQLTEEKKLIDLVGVQTTRVNAQLFLSAMSQYKLQVSTVVPWNIQVAQDMFSMSQFVVMGGTEPGQTTDAVAVKLASTVKTKKIINFSNVDCIYTDDPNKNKKARRIHKMTHKELADLLIKAKHKPGQNLVFDQLATTLAKVHDIEIHFVGTLDDFEKALQGKKHKGTVVKN